MLRYLIVVGFLLALSAVHAMEPRCLEYEPSIVNLSGTIKRVTFPGPPNYESIEKGDRPETYWILVLERPVCVSADPKEPMNVAEARVVEVQLILRDYAKYKHLLGSRVLAKGKLMHKFTGHHHTLVLLQATEIQSTPNNSLQPTSALTRRRG